MKLRLVIFCLLFSLSGCRYVRWGSDVFYQSKIQFTYDALRNDYIRTLRVYDQFTTLGLFDILWLSDEVRSLYAREYAAFFGYSNAMCEAFLQEQLAENNSKISFYILASTPHVQDILLTEDATPWNMYLRVDGINYHPKSLEYIDDLTQPYKTFFGKRYTMFRDVYLLSFPATTASGCPIITPSTRSFALCFHKPGIVDECVAWELVGPGKARVCCIDNPDVLAYDM